jgi:hypothetical protein
MKAHAYSNTYQMHEMRGQFTGVDTMRLLDQQILGSNLKVQQLHESLSIEGCTDIKAMIGSWKDQGI